jgi:DNA mismatch repair ATPase MutS
MMRRLERLMELADARYSGASHFVVQTVGLWDFHVVHALEGWQRAAGPHVRRWFEGLGTAEAVSALATLAHDNPDWVLPDLSPPRGDGARIEAEALGHPLLQPARRVDNDVSVGPPGTFLLVTGSNMSGKSTLLRALGCNVVLAQAGGPVCARAMRMPPLALFTSMRVEDSLERGVSFFMAELRRLKMVVDGADAAAGGGVTPLYLLDEILQGTNTAERRTAVRRVVRHLLDAGALGAITTHDLALAEIENLKDAAVPVHFEETVHEREPPPDAAILSGHSGMSFDYRLRQGVATSTNALALMRLIGLATEDDA